MTSLFLPEGKLLNTIENRMACGSVEGLQSAMREGRILEGVVRLCDADHNLEVDLGSCVGTIPRTEAALGILEGSAREIAILSRVGKPVCFQVQSLDLSGGVPHPRLSRRAVQRRALDWMLDHLCPGSVIPAVVSHLEPFGAFVDIGCGVNSMIGIENISVSRISHPDERFSVGQGIWAAVLDLDREKERIYLTHKELLGTWEENAARFQPGMTVPGIVRGVKDYGVFVELTPNLSGLAERREGLQEGDAVSVYIKAILPERMKIKLLAIDRLPKTEGTLPLTYFLREGPIKKWRYAPPGCVKVGSETIFSGE